MQKTTSGPQKRYAKALFELAQEKNVSLNASLEAMASVLNDNTDLQAFLSSPAATNAQKGELLATMAKEAKADDLLVNFLALLAEKGRSELLADVIFWYQGMERAANGVVQARVESAASLTDAQRKEITSFVKANTEGTKEVLLEESVDASLIAGVKVNVAATEFDATVRGKLNGLRLALK